VPFGKRQPTRFLGIDRRRAARTKVDTPGELVLADRQTMRCYVRDISSTGARLELSSTFGLTDTLSLRIAGRRCWAKVAWSTGRQIGVQFV